MVKRITNDEYQEEMKRLNPDIIPIEEFQNSKTPVKCRCKKCGHIWAITIGNVKQGRRCPKCSRKEVTKRQTKTNEQYLAEMKQLNPDIIPLEEYQNATIPVECRCKKCGHIWGIRIGDVRSGKGCPECAQARRIQKQTKTNEQFISEMKRISPSIELIETYKNAKTKIKYRCTNCGIERWATPDELLRGKKCQNCLGVKLRNNEEFIRDVNIINPQIEPLEQFVRTDTKIKIRCKICGYVWNARPNHILEGHGCPECGGSRTKTNEEFIHELKLVNPDINPITPYVNRKTKITCLCKTCGREFASLPSSLLYGSGCTKCDGRRKTSFPEQALFYYISKSYPDTINRYRNGFGRSEIDVYIPSIKTGIEYDGEYWHKDKTDKEIKKYEVCREKGIRLIRVREGSDEASNSSDITILREKPYDFESLEKSINEVLAFLGINQKANIEADAPSIRKQFYINIGNSSLQVKYPAIAKEWDYINNGEITPAMVSYASNEKYWWICPGCKKPYQAAVSDRTRGRRRCDTCGRKEQGRKRRMSNEEFLSRLAETNPNIEAMESYTTAHVPIKCKCKLCGHIWSGDPAGLIRGSRCPQCKNANNT